MGIVRVKICGLTRIEDINYAIDSGADAVGFIFGYPDSPRNISFKKIAELIAKVPPYVSSVVVSPASNNGLVRVIDEIRPSYLQLYSEKPNGMRIKSASVIETVHVATDSSANSLISRCMELSRSCRGLFLDSVSKKKSSSGENLLGGTGVTHDWSLSRRIRDAIYPFPVILAGGLNERNVREAINVVQPFAVDVSSGVEVKPGIKDKTKVMEFIQNAKSA